MQKISYSFTGDCCAALVLGGSRETDHRVPPFSVLTQNQNFFFLLTVEKAKVTVVVVVATIAATTEPAEHQNQKNSQQQKKKQRNLFVFLTHSFSTPFEKRERTTQPNPI